MQSSALAPIRRTAAEVAKASLEELIAEMDIKKPLYNTEAVDSGSDIGGTGGIWQKAQDAVGRIFGYTRAANPNEVGDILGDDPWRGARVDPNEVDDVISALQRMVGVLSDAAEFAAEFEQVIDGFAEDADDFFSSIASRVRFGSTDATRYGAYAVTAGGTRAAEGMWDTGVFLYTPLDAPRTSEIPTRGSATFSGSTVAVLNGSGTADDPNAVGAVSDPQPQLYAGKISLDVSFSQTRVTGTVTDLKDEDGDPLRLPSSFTFRDEIVASITLPEAADGAAARDGLYTSSAANSTISFGPSIQTQTSGDSTFRVQLVDDATEALGIWRTAATGFRLEGAFGATRSGSVTTPRLPTESDRGSHVAGPTAMYVSPTGTGTFTDTDADGKYTFALDQTNIGGVGPAAGLSFQTERLYSSSSHPERGSTYISEIRSAINAARSGLNATNFGDRITDANAALVRIVSGFPQISAAAELDAARTALNSAYAALGSERSFYNAVRAQADRNDNVAADGFFAGATDYTQDQIRTIFAERTIDFRLRTARTTYTRFGVWSQRSAADAVGNALDTNTIQNGSFAFGPRAVSGNARAGLTFVADYSGRVLAVETDSGNLYGGSFELRVNWADTDGGNVSATISDLRGIDGTSSLFRHDNRDVKTIFLTGFDEAAGVISTGSAAGVQVRYTDTSVQDAAFTAAGTAMAGGFIGDSTEGPIGVLGTWSIPADTGGLSKEMRGSFGADLKP